MPPNTAATWVIRDVVRTYGGTSKNLADQSRAEKHLQELCDCSDSIPSLRPRVRVLATSQPVAFAVAPRDLFISEGLLAISNDDEVRAALAHELGHLAEEHPPRITSLSGHHGHGCPEERADQFSVALLSKGQFDTRAMGSLLTLIIEHESTTPSLREHLTHRRGLLPGESSKPTN